MSKQASNNQPMTDEQVENFRKVLASMLGPYALLMQREDIVKCRDRMQEYANRIKGSTISHTVGNNTPKREERV